MHRDTVARYSETHCRAIHPPPPPPHNARICTQFLEAVPVLPWPAYSPNMSPIEHVWNTLRQRVPVPTNIQQLCTVGQHLHRPRSTLFINYVKVMCRAAWGKLRSHQILTSSYTHPYFFLSIFPKVSVTNKYSQSCEIHRLGPNEFNWLIFIIQSK
jgi:hypothetical protein